MKSHRKLKLCKNNKASQAFAQSTENFVLSLKFEEKYIIQEKKIFLENHKPLEMTDHEYFKEKLHDHLKGSKFILRRHFTK